MRQDYVDLNRTFYEFGDTQDAEDAAARSYLISLRGTGEFTWTNVLESRCAVILGEAGSGKTWEFEAQAEKLWCSGVPAFYLRIEEIARTSFRDALKFDDVQLFDDWLSADEEGFFFLDSVDEARIERHSWFYEALNRVFRAIGSKSRSQIRLIISSRITEWRHSEDSAELRIILKLIKPKKVERIPIQKPLEEIIGEVEIEKKSEAEEIDGGKINVFELAPLNDRQVKSLAASYLPAGSDAFVSAIEYNDLWAFAGRPLDVKSLAGYWIEHNKLGSLRQIISFDIDKKLLESEERQRHDPLSKEKVRNGAETLAAAASLCRKSAFPVSDSAQEIGETGKIIDPREVLPSDWESGEIQALLARPIFDEASFGKIRFHHRSVLEYLAAQWIAKRKRLGCPDRKIFEILFKVAHGRETIARSLAPVAAWLCLGSEDWNKAIFYRTLRTNPEVLLEFGDAQSLDLEQKTALLDAIVTLYGNQEWVRLNPDRLQLRRLADPELSPVINAHLSNLNLSRELRMLFVELVESGCLRNCAEAVLSIAINDEADAMLRAYAMRAVAVTGRDEHLQQIAKYANSLEEISEDLAGALFETLYPAVIDVESAVDLVRKSAPSDIISSLRMPYVLEWRVIEEIPNEHLEPWLRGLVTLIRQRPWMISGADEIQISSRYCWLIKSVHKISLRLLSSEDLSGPQVELLAEALYVLTIGGRHNVDHLSSQLSVHEKSLNHPNVRRAYAWFSSKVDNDSRRPEANFHQIFDGRHGAIGAVLGDKIWILRDLMDDSDLEKRRQALHWGISLRFAFGRSKVSRRKLIDACGKDPVLGEICWARMPGIVRSTYDVIRDRWETERKWGFRYRISRWTNKWAKFHNKIRNRIWFLRRLSDLRAGREFHALDQLAHHRSLRLEERNSGATVEEHISFTFGAHVARAARSGWISFWRGYCPWYPHTYKENTGCKMDSVGLRGIAAELDDGLDFAQLSDAEARIACHYALHELNGFPPWFEDLVNAHTETARHVLEQCLAGEWNVSGDFANYSGVVYDLEYSADLILEIAFPLIRDRLIESEPVNADVLRHAVNAVLKARNPVGERFQDLPPERIRTYDVQSAQFLTWITVWFCFDGARAMSYLRAFLREEAVNSHETVAAVCSSLRQTEFNEKFDPSFLDIDILPDFIRLVYEHINPANDRVPGQGTYSVTDRDNARDFREYLVNRLAEHSDQTAYQALLKLADDPIVEPHRNWILNRCDERAKRDAEGAPWRPCDIADFEQDFEKAPATGDDLFEIALNRIDDVKGSVESADFSRRREVDLQSDERVFQVWLARQLDEASRGRYSAHREEEVDAGREPDIRLANPGISPIGIEVKLSDSGSFTALEKALENQLVGRYLRAIESRHGILLIVHRGGQDNWRPKDAAAVDFAGLIAMLDDKAQQIKDARADIDGLRVIGIDFTPPIL